MTASAAGSSPKPIVALIWAMASNGVIGRDNALPWRLPADLQHFKALTTGHPVLMGRRTFESLGRPLPNRTNIVVTRDRDFAPAGVQVAHSLDEALAIATADLPADRQVFVIGGENLYTQMLPHAERLYVTMVDAEIEGDARFPELDWRQWRELERREHPADDRNRYACRFLTLERKTPHR
jgi:dihydrofolate reductase